MAITGLLRRRQPPAAGIAISVDPRPIYPGDTLAAEITVTARRDLIAGPGLLRLEATELLEIDSARDAPPRMARALRPDPLRPGSASPGSIECVFADAVRLPAGGILRAPAQLTLPPDAPPTVKGKHARITWRLSARLTSAGASPGAGHAPGLLSRLAHASPGHLDQELVVFARPDPAHIGGEPLPPRPCATRAYRNVRLDLALDTGLVANGGIVSGVLSVLPRVSFAARELRIDLTRWERSGSKQARITASRQILQRPALLTAGETTEWAFYLPVPDRLMPSTLARHTFVGWQVRAVLARPLRPDFSVAQAVQVYTAPR